MVPMVRSARDQDHTSSSAAMQSPAQTKVITAAQLQGSQPPNLPPPRTGRCGAVNLHRYKKRITNPKNRRCTIIYSAPFNGAPLNSAPMCTIIYTSKGARTAHAF